LYEETYDLDYLSFLEVETVVKKFGYQPSDLIYYHEPSKELDDGLILITFDENVIKMAEVFLGHKLVVLYTVSFTNTVDEVGPNVEVPSPLVDVPTIASSTASHASSSSVINDC
jgi:hypothetical protein